MTITHQTVLDKDGKPTAALIPWEEFQVIKAELEVGEDAPLSPEWKDELERRSRELDEGTVQGISSDEVFVRVSETLRNHSSSKQSA